MLDLLEQIIKETGGGLHWALFEIRRAQRSSNAGSWNYTWIPATSADVYEVLELRDNDQVLTKIGVVGELRAEGTVITVANVLSSSTKILDLADPESLPELITAVHGIARCYIADLIVRSEQARRPHYVKMWREVSENYEEIAACDLLP